MVQSEQRLKLKWWRVEGEYKFGSIEWKAIHLNLSINVEENEKVLGWMKDQFHLRDRTRFFYIVQADSGTSAISYSFSLFKQQLDKGQDEFMEIYHPLGTSLS